MCDDWPTQPDGRSWIWTDGDMPNDWRSRLSRAAVVEDARAIPQVWLGIDLVSGELDGRRYVLVKGDGQVDDLLNPNFEGAYTARGDGNVMIAEGWEPWHDETQTRPEWKAETRNIGKGRVNAGEKAQKMFTTYANHDAGIWQRIGGVTPGAWYEFLVWLYVWTSGKDDPDVSNKWYHAMVGANPWGHWPEHYATIWGKEVPGDSFNVYTPVSIVFQAWDSMISLVVRGKTDTAAKHNDLYIDSAEFRQVQVYIDEKPPTEPPTEPGEPVDLDELAKKTAGLIIPKLGVLVDSQTNAIKQMMTGLTVVTEISLSE